MMQERPCNFPNCDCSPPKLHKGAIAIAIRLFNEANARKVYGRKGLPLHRLGSTLCLRECVAEAWIKSQEKANSGG